MTKLELTEKELKKISDLVDEAYCFAESTDIIKDITEGKIAPLAMIYSDNVTTDFEPQYTELTQKDIKLVRKLAHNAYSMGKIAINNKYVKLIAFPDESYLSLTTPRNFVSEYFVNKEEAIDAFGEF